MAKIESIREWAEVCLVDHVIKLELGDESGDDCIYEFNLTPGAARDLAAQLVAVAEEADGYYDEDEDAFDGDGEGE